MKTSLKTGFAQVFSCCPKKAELPKIWEGLEPPSPPPGPYAYGGSKPLKCLKPSYYLKKDYPLKLMKTYLFRFISSIYKIYNIIKSKLRANGPNIVGCYLLCPFAHPVACCWEFSCAKFETGQTFSYVQTEATTPNCWANKVGSCCIRLHV